MSDRLREEQIKKTLDYINSIENAIEQPNYNLERKEEYKVNIRVDQSVENGLFKPDPLNPQGWIANEQTYRAMKKDIFALGPDLLELEQVYQCHSCKTELDKQFWNFCPYCTASFLS